MLKSELINKLYPKQRNRCFSLFFSLAFLLTVIAPQSATAQGDLLITPRRIVFDGGKKTQQINLANNGQETATYVISFKEYKMLEDGSFEEITEPDPGQYFASNNLRFFPRSVTLAPAEAQVVKVQLSKTRGLEDGEYRSHIYFRAVPDEDAVPLGEEDQAIDTTTLSIKLTPIFGITIPVIFRIGDTSAEVSLSDLSLNMEDPDNPKLKMTFNRSGNMSVYGNIEVDHVSPTGERTQVGVVKGIAVYTPNTKRDFQLSLLKTANEVNYNSGRLEVKYTGASDVKSSTLAEAELVLD